MFPFLFAIQYHIFKKILGLSIVCSKGSREYKKYLKKIIQYEILKMLDLITKKSIRKNVIMTEGNISQEFRLKNIGEIRNYFIEEINQNKLMRKKHKNVCRVLNYIETLFIVVSTFSGCVSISVFTYLVAIPVGITSSAVRLKTCVINAGIIKDKSIIMKKKKKHDIVLLTNHKLNYMEVLILKASIDLNINYDELICFNE